MVTISKTCQVKTHFLLSPLFLGQIKLSQCSLGQFWCCRQTEGCGQLNQLHCFLGRAVAAKRRQEVLQQPRAGEECSRKHTVYAKFVPQFTTCLICGKIYIAYINYLYEYD